MNTLLLIMTLVTAFFVGMFVVGLAKGDEDLCAVAFVILVFIGLFGWLAAGVGAPAGGKASTKLTAKVLHDGEVIHLSQGGDIITTFKDVHTYHLLSDKEETPVVGTYYLNMYGCPTTGTNWTIPE